MKIKYLGHSCIEIIGKHHIVIDSDFTKAPEPNVDFILTTHAHRDHIGRLCEIPTGLILASPDVCTIARDMGVSSDRLHPVTVGDTIANIRVLEGFSRVGGGGYSFFHLLFRWRLPDPGGTPLSFLVEDKLSLLHIGDAFDFDLEVQADILCLPWRKSPFFPEQYKHRIVAMSNQISNRYVISIHHDLPGTEANPAEIAPLIKSELLFGSEWFFE